MRKTLIATLLICLTQVAVAQTSIVGRIFDADENTPIPFAQVAIFSVQDTALIAGTTTGDDGSFTIDRVRAGSYIFRAMFMGYTSIEKIVEIIDESRPLELGRINLSQGIDLAGFEISEMFIPVQIRGDTIDFNAEAFRPVEGSPLADLLRRLPGVEIDDEGRITVGGREVTNILVDGEPFFSDDPQVAAQNIPADFVQRVRTYNRRSRQAQFTGIDDGDEEVVIDLSFRPGMSQGWFGRLTGGVGIDAVSRSSDFRHDNSFNINYFRGRNQLTLLGGFNNVNNLGFTDIMGGAGQQVIVMGGGGGGRGGRGGGGGMGGFGGMMGGITQSFSPGLNFVMRLNDNLTIGGSYAFSNTNREQEQRTFRENILPLGSQFYDERRESNPIANQHRFNAEIRYTPNDDNELIIRPSFTFGRTENNIFSDFSTWNDEGDSINRGETHNFSDAMRFDSRLRVDYRRRLSVPQRTISFGFDGGFSSNDREETNFSDIIFWETGIIQPNDTIHQRVTDEGWRYNWRAQVVYTEPLIHDFTLELRYSISYSEDWSERIARDYVTEQIDNLFSNEFSNTFFNQRFEARLQRSTENYRLSFGAAVTPSWINSYSIENGTQTNIGREDPLVWNWSPQAQFQYNFSRQHTLRFTYTGRTNQPSVSQLQPVPDNSDLMNIRVGNPGLSPEFTHSIRVMYNNFFENFSSLSANVFFNLTQNRIINTTITREGQLNPDLINNNPQLADIPTLSPGARIIMPVNIGNVYNVFGMVAYSTPLFSQRITLSSTTGGGVTHTKSMIDLQTNELNNIMFNQNLRVTYRLPRFDVSLNGRYQLNSARHTLSDNNTDFHTLSGGADFTWQIVRNRLFISSDMNFSETFGADNQNFNRSFWLWNAQLSLNIGQNNAGQLRLRVVDILDQNRNGNNRLNATENRVEHIWVNTLPRYVIVSFTYNINTSLRQSAPQQDGVRGTGDRRIQMPPGHGGRPGGQQVIIHQ
ncbi:MAG: TonB-dependent receptor [Bacteroidales bacterium]|nr:TonB-dependent receptor [Bacteroidales bacterium]